MTKQIRKPLGKPESVSATLPKQKPIDTRAELALKLEPLIAPRAKENLKTSTGGANPRPSATLPKAERIDTRAEISKSSGAMGEAARILASITTAKQSGTMAPEEKRAIFRLRNAITHLNHCKRKERVVADIYERVRELQRAALPVLSLFAKAKMDASHLFRLLRFSSYPKEHCPDGMDVIAALDNLELQLSGIPKIPGNPVLEEADQFLRDNPGAKPKTVCEQIPTRVTYQHFRSKIVPELKQRGFYRPRGRQGLYPPKSVG